ncbi:Transcription factor CA150 [Phaffia rhodozyma]|uniref:Transcription factor CA150 n=1 Tax=Phaffia rhodozyma TaxID=264483 RepID=A0A0F7SKS4_PHARH|nr:Transcription factor CA150 [Phaffia rhodozyma]
MAHQQHQPNYIPPPPPTLPGMHQMPPPQFGVPLPPTSSSFMGPPPLPPGWTEHIAQGGTPYWYNASTNQSVWTRPLPSYPPPNYSVPPPGYPAFPPPSSLQQPTASSSNTDGDGDGGKKKKKKFKSKTIIEGTKWTRIETLEGDVFYLDKESKESVWEVPEEIKEQVAELEAAEKARLAEIEAAETARLAEKKAEEERVAQTEIERIRAELAASTADFNSRKRKVSPTEDEPTAETKQPKLKSIPTGPSIAKKANPEPEVDIDLLSNMHNQESDSETDEPTGDGEDGEGEQDGIGPQSAEDEEAWQRAVAAEMGIEYLSPEDRIKKEREEKEKTKRDEKEKLEKDEEEARSKVFSTRGKIEMTVEEGRALFKTLLYEKEVSPVAPWETSLPHFINDPRYVLLSSLKDRKEVFEEYCKEKARAIRQAKLAAQQQSSNTSTASEETERKLSPEEAYRALLKKEVKSTRTRWEEFRKGWKKDRRFFAFGRDDREREKAFKSWLRELGEVKRAAVKKAEEDFFALLAESSDLGPDSSWKDVKRKFERDPRYDAVGSSSLREELFQSFLKRPSKQTTSAESKSSSAPLTAAELEAQKAKDKKERAEASLREREEKVRAQQGKIRLETGRARGMVGREEAEREFGSLLVDTVKEHDASWSHYVPVLEKDARFNSPSLNLGDKHRLFTTHLATLESKRFAALHALFLAHSPLLQTSFQEIYAPISGEFAVTRLNLTADQLEDEYDRWSRTRFDRARAELNELLKENAFVGFWAGLKNKEESKKEKAIGLEEGYEEDEEDEEGDEGGGKANLKEMASKIDLREIESVLKHDRRYRLFDHLPEERERWIKEHISTLVAPGASVHVNHS